MDPPFFRLMRCAANLVVVRSIKKIWPLTRLHFYIRLIRCIASLDIVRGIKKIWPLTCTANLM